MSSLLIHITIYNAGAVAALAFILLKNPRYMMQDYPKEITANIPEKTKQEKRESLLFGLPFTLILFVYPLAFGLYGKFALSFGFFENTFRILMLMISFNVVDLLIVDWLVFCLITPKFIVLPGTAGHRGYKNYVFHFHAFIKGTVMIAIVSIVLSLIIEGIIWIF